MMKHILAVVTLLAILAVAPVRAAAPDIQLLDLQGKPQNVNATIGKGKWVIVTVWAHDCGICVREIHEMTSFHKTNLGRDALVLGVSLDGKGKIEAARKFVRDHKLPFVNLVAEPEQEVMVKFGAGEFVGTPTYYVYDPKGELVAQQVGPLTQAEVEKFLVVLRAEAAAAKPKATESK
jgi:peroxiredoxin